jgi:hypothetical protein
MNTNDNLLLNLIEKNIIKKKVDYIKIHYYPFYKINSTSEIELMDHDQKENISGNDILKFIKKSVKNNDPIKLSYTEFKFRDTFVRNCDNNLQYFRMESHLFSSYDIGTGIFVIEFYILCDEANFPYIIKYDCDISYDVISNNCGNYNLCYTHSIDNIKNKKYIYFDINTDINIDNFEQELKDFFGKIKVLDLHS